MDAIPTGDTSVWSKYLDKNFFIVTEDGTRYTRKSFLATFQHMPNGYSGWIKVTQPKLEFHDSIAVIAYVSDEHELFWAGTTYHIQHHKHILQNRYFMDDACF